MSQTLEPVPDLGDGVGDGADDRIVLRGVVDETIGARLGSMLADRLAVGVADLAVDLSAVEAIDEQGLVAIVRAWHEVSAVGCVLRLLDPSPAIGPLLAMTGLTASYSDR